jgi:hypothetical protein
MKSEVYDAAQTGGRKRTAHRAAPAISAQGASTRPKIQRERKAGGRGPELRGKVSIDGVTLLDLGAPGGVGAFPVPLRRRRSSRLSVQRR